VPVLNEDDGAVDAMAELSESDINRGIVLVDGAAFALRLDHRSRSRPRGRYAPSPPGRVSGITRRGVLLFAVALIAAGCLHAGDDETAARDRSRAAPTRLCLATAVVTSGSPPGISASAPQV
jgi:hypothetical protein